MKFRHAVLVSSALMALAGCAQTTTQGSKGAGNVQVAPPPPLSPAPLPSRSAPPLMSEAVQDHRLSEVQRNEAAKHTGPALIGRFVPPIIMPQTPNNERYKGEEISPVSLTAEKPVSTFSVDVDTGSYSNMRRHLKMGNLPPKDAVRTEEMLNYFRYDYPLPETRDTPFSVTMDTMETPWNSESRLLRIGLRGYDLPRNQRPPANLVFLVDVSGSMGSQDKLPLVKTALAGLADELGPNDRVSIVTYSGVAGLALEPTNNPRKIRAALDKLEASGGTAGGAGMQLAYQIARDNKIEGGINRVLMATDGDFNVGIANTVELLAMVERQREAGITLSTLGFGTGNYNEAMMERVADKGNGNYSYIDSALEARKVLSEEMSSTLFTIAQDVKIQVEFNPALVSQYRLIGYENRVLREEDFNNDKVDAGDIGASHQVTALYEIIPVGRTGWIDSRRYAASNTPNSSDNTKEVAHVKLRYKLPDGQTSRLIEKSFPLGWLYVNKPPEKDMYFAAAVAAYGQNLRGDPLMNGFTYQQIKDLAGPQTDYLRQEFLQLVDVAGSISKN